MKYTIEMVMIKLLDGKKMRKTNWRKKNYMHLNENGELVYRNGEVATLSQGEWEVFDDEN